MIEKMEFGEPLGSMLQGSANNGCDMRACDVDCKCGIGNYEANSAARSTSYSILKGNSNS